MRSQARSSRGGRSVLAPVAVVLLAVGCSRPVPSRAVADAAPRAAAPPTAAARLDAAPATQPDAAPASRPAAPRYTDYCVIAGTVAPAGFAKAQALTEKVRGLGHADAAVWDARDFEDLTWGQLVVIATGGPKAAMKAAAANLTAAGVKAHARPCTQTGGAPLASGAAIAPTRLGTTPAVIEAGATIVPGCFAWSPKHHQPACIARRSDPLEGELELRLYGAADNLVFAKWAGAMQPEPTTYTPAAAQQLNAALRAGAFVVVDVRRRKVKPRTTVLWADPWLAVRWARPRVERVRTPDGGSWDVFDDRVEVDCGHGRWVEALTAESVAAPDESTSVALTLVPGRRYLLVERTVKGCIEGGCTEKTEAARFDLREGCVPPP